jgi:hypothetical protein
VRNLIRIASNDARKLSLASPAGDTRLTGSGLQCLGAGDGNRTRTASLGVCAVQASTTRDMQGGESLSDREGPPFTGSVSAPEDQTLAVC